MGLQQILDAADVVRGVTLHRYRLDLAEPWRWSGGAISGREGFLVRVTSGDGHSGVGDCAPLPEFGTEQLADARSAASEIRDAMAGRSVAECIRHMQTWHATPALHCAVETALLGLVAERLALPLHHLLATDARPEVAVNAVVGAADAGLAVRADAAIRAGFDVIKIKVGVDAAEDELRCLRELCARLPSHIRLRLDANGAWDYRTARTVVTQLSDLPVECLEEPLASAEIGSLKKLQDLAGFPLALDESLPPAADDALIRRGIVRRIVLKPTVRGGIMSCLALAEAALDAGVECVVTSALESPVGLLACAQLAAAIPGGLAHGLATGEWFVATTLPWPRPVDGVIRLSPRPGLGIDTDAGIESISSSYPGR